MTLPRGSVGSTWISLVDDVEDGPTSASKSPGAPHRTGRRGRISAAVITSSRRPSKGCLLIHPLQVPANEDDEKVIRFASG